MPQKPDKPKVDAIFKMAIEAAFYDVADVGPDAGCAETRTKTSQVRRDVVRSFLDGRFRCCLRKAVRHLIIAADGPKLKQRAVAHALGVTEEHVRKCKEGLGLMSGAAWTWFVCRMAEQLETFEAPTLEERAIAGYCESMGLVDAAMNNSKPDLATQPSKAEFLLLWVTFGSGVLTRQSTLEAPQLTREQAEALMRMLGRWFPDEPELARIDSPARVRAAAAEAASRWGVAYAVAVSRVTMDWTKERRRVT